MQLCVPIEKIREAAITYAKADRGCILYDQGMSQHYVGTDNVRIHANLALLCGHAGKPGSGINSMRGQINGEGSGDMGCLCVFYPGFKRVGEETAKFFGEAWGVTDLPTKPGLTYIDMLYKCPYLYIVGGDPMMAVPDVNNVKKALEKANFLVVQDIFPTEIAKLAHVVLPAATWVEREATHTWIDRRVQKIDKLVDPPGESKPDWWIICQLAERMGYKDKFDFASAGEIFEEIRNCVPQYKGITYERLRNTVGGIHWPCPSEDHPGTPTMFLQKFNTPDGLGHFQAVEFKPPAEVPDEAYPYFLTTGRSVFHYHTGAMTRRTPRLVDEVPRGFVQVNPEDASKEGVKDRDTVVLETRRGSIEAEARITDEVRPGLLFIPIHFPDSCANALTISALDPSAKCAETKVCAVKIEVKR
jgi:formate dehydrogenase major subunit